MKCHVLKKNKKFIKYVISGGFAALFEFVTFSILHWMKSDLLICQCISYIAGLLVSFSLNKIWVFKSKSKALRQLFQYVLLAIINLLLTSIIISILVDNLKINGYIAKIIVMGCVVAWNFILYKLVIFKED